MVLRARLCVNGDTLLVSENDKPEQIHNFVSYCVVLAAGTRQQWESGKVSG